VKKFSYKQVTRYLDDCLIFGIKPDLTRIKKILELTGNPHKKNDFIHIVGTNGKTSTTIITASILKSHGLKCGYHISPHINSYTERIWIDGKDISESNFEDIFNFLYPYIEKVNSLNLGGPMTQFEIIAAMAFTAAVNKKLDVMVLEAGMGGRWDATNAAYSKVVGFTGVSLEHTQILGKNITEIAIEKAEVVKNNALVATLSRSDKVLKVLKNKVEKTNSKLYIYGKDFYILNKHRDCLKGWKTDIKGIISSYKGLNVPLIGNYQPFNLSLSIALSELYLNALAKKINDKLLRSSLKNLKVLGRFQIIKKIPLVIADTSHNPEGIKNFVKNIKECFNDFRKIVIFAVLKDKDYKKMTSSILEISDILILTSSKTDRSLYVDELEKEVKKAVEIKKQNKEEVDSGIMPEEIYKIDNISNSLNYALKISKSSDIICITGSITNLENIV
jgi:dihydrofolate synthase/folylpolyglutamate synthase